MHSRFIVHIQFNNYHICDVWYVVGIAEGEILRVGATHSTVCEF